MNHVETLLTKLEQASGGQTLHSDMENLQTSDISHIVKGSVKHDL